MAHIIDLKIYAYCELNRLIIKFYCAETREILPTKQWIDISQIKSNI
jgi:hypothetical protein